MRTPAEAVLPGTAGQTRGIIAALDVRDAYRYTMEAAANAGSGQETFERILKLVASHTSGDRFVAKVLGKELGLEGS